MKIKTDSKIWPCQRTYHQVGSGGSSQGNPACWSTSKSQLRKIKTASCKNIANCNCILRGEVFVSVHRRWELRLLLKYNMKHVASFCSTQLVQGASEVYYYGLIHLDRRPWHYLAALVLRNKIASLQLFNGLYHLCYCCFFFVGQGHCCLCCQGPSWNEHCFPSPSPYHPENRWILTMMIVMIIISNSISGTRIISIRMSHLPEWESHLVACRILLATVRRLSCQEG